jgi:hypothetical protein
MRAADHADDGFSSHHPVITTDPFSGSNNAEEILPRGRGFSTRRRIFRIARQVVGDLEPRRLAADEDMALRPRRRVVEERERDTVLRGGVGKRCRRFPVRPGAIDDRRAALAAEAALIAARAFVIFDQVLALEPPEILRRDRTRLLNAAPCCLRHSEQWQFSGASRGPVISNWMPPQRQAPRIGGMVGSVVAEGRVGRISRRRNPPIYAREWRITLR